MFDIILPTLGRRLLTQAVHSVLEQSFQDWRLWIIYDNPEPETRIWDIYEDPRIHTLFIDDGPHEDWGATARNYGIKTATQLVDDYQWIAYIDDDDRWLPCHLEVLRANTVTRSILRTCGYAIRWSRERAGKGKLTLRRKYTNMRDILTPGLAHTREIFFLTKGWRECDNHDKLLVQDMIGAGGTFKVIEELTFEYLRGKPWMKN